MRWKSSITFKIIISSLLLVITLFTLLSLSSCRRSKSSPNDRVISRNNDRKDSSPRNRSNNMGERNVRNLKSIYENTIKYWQYDEAAYFYNYTPQERIQSGRGICWDYALFFYNACQENGVRDVHFVVSNKLKHAWNELWVKDTVYIIDATWADTNPYESIDKYFMVDASSDEEHYEIDICVVDDTMEQNDISSLYRGILNQDAKRQKYTAARPIVKLKR
ncbi:MAG: transglutaminase-like domain-containing protein [Prevotella sp.]|nr:transglutaminase-like domain-containing protein [Prevotella sp.]